MIQIGHMMCILTNFRSTEFDSSSTNFGSLNTKYNSKTISKFHFGGGNIELYIDHEIRHSRLLTIKFQFNVKYILLQSTTIKNVVNSKILLIVLRTTTFSF